MFYLLSIYCQQYKPCEYNLLTAVQTIQVQFTDWNRRNIQVQFTGCSTDHSSTIYWLQYRPFKYNLLIAVQTVQVQFTGCSTDHSSTIYWLQYRPSRYNSIFIEWHMQHLQGCHRVKSTHRTHVGLFFNLTATAIHKPIRTVSKATTGESCQRHKSQRYKSFHIMYIQWPISMSVYICACKDILHRTYSRLGLLKSAHAKLQIISHVHTVT